MGASGSRQGITEPSFGQSIDRSSFGDLGACHVEQSETKKYFWQKSGLPNLFYPLVCCALRTRRRRPLQKSGSWHGRGETIANLSANLGKFARRVFGGFVHRDS